MWGSSDSSAMAGTGAVAGADEAPTPALKMGIVSPTNPLSTGCKIDKPGTRPPDVEDRVESWTGISEVSWKLCSLSWSCLCPQKLVWLLSPNLDLADLHDVKTKMNLELVHLERDH